MEVRVTAVIVAAGRGERLAGDVPKQLRDLGGIPILEWSVRAFLTHASIDAVVVVLPPDLEANPPGFLRGRVEVAPGGATRAESVVRGVAAASPETEIVLIHDGVRPFVRSGIITRVCESAATAPTVPVIAVVDTIKRVDPHGRVEETLDRVPLRRAQTPQGFPARLLRELHAGAAAPADITDDALLCERAGLCVRAVEGDPMNLKVTATADLTYARWVVECGMIVPATLE